MITSPLPGAVPTSNVGAYTICLGGHMRESTTWRVQSSALFTAHILLNSAGALGSTASAGTHRRQMISMSADFRIGCRLGLACATAEFPASQPSPLNISGTFDITISNRLGDSSSCNMLAAICSSIPFTLLSIMCR